MYGYNCRMRNISLRTLPSIAIVLGIVIGALASYALYHQRIAEELYPSPTNFADNGREVAHVYGVIHSVDLEEDRVTLTTTDPYDGTTERRFVISYDEMTKIRTYNGLLRSDQDPYAPATEKELRVGAFGNITMKRDAMLKAYSIVTVCTSVLC